MLWTLLRASWSLDGLLLLLLLLLLVAYCRAALLLATLPDCSKAHKIVLLRAELPTHCTVPGEGMPYRTGVILSERLDRS